MNTRIIARLDVKGTNLIKGVHLEGLRVIGPVNDYAQKYYEQGADELVYMDIVASLYGRNSLTEIVSLAASDIFIPLTVGGGIRSVEDVNELLRAGADKVAINTAVVQNPELISQVSRRFGSQCMVLSIEAKKISDLHWEVYTDCGRERSGVDVVEWAKRGEELGAGEIMLTSIDQEGTERGYDCDLIQAVTDFVTIPVIASGGYGHFSDFVKSIKSGASAVAVAGHLHYEKTSIAGIRDSAKNIGLKVREVC
jgi:imidazole glycerol-phosphate synthase subunit HisF